MIAGQASLAEHFGASLGRQERLHFAAHSHHPWPDVTRQAHLRAWEVAAAHLDHKWSRLLQTEYPEAARHVARRLGVADAEQIVFAQNTHELLVRICSGLSAPMRVLTTDAEFHSATRQLQRWAESGHAIAEHIPVEPFATFPDRFTAAMRAEHDLVLFSHVLYSSGYVLPDLGQIVAAVPSLRTTVIVDGYHAFMAFPVDLGAIADRAFYLGGGYKYAMSGEGACFASAPPGYIERPVNTGWFATFASLAGSASDDVAYPSGAARFAGSTFEPSGLFRFNAVQRWLDGLGVDVRQIHDHVRVLQESFLDSLHTGPPAVLGGAELVPGREVGQRGHFLTFRTGGAGALAQTLAERGVVVDHRGDRLRFGFGVYHSLDDVERLLQILREIN